MLKVADLFSGIGGFSLGLQNTGGFETVAFCEKEAFCQRVLYKHWPHVPIYPDIKLLTGKQLGEIDVLCGGYPCQPVSTAGKRQGTADDRYLWPEMYRLVVEARPRWVIAENVTGHISMGLDEVLSDLESAFYTTTVFVLPACAVDAPHRRDRVWIVAHTDSQSQSTSTKHGNKGCRELGSVANTDQQGSQGWNGKELRERAGKCPSRESHTRKQQFCWLPEPPVGRVVDGLPNRVDRLKALGNAVVPQITEALGRAILTVEKGTVK